MIKIFQAECLDSSWINWLNFLGPVKYLNKGLYDCNIYIYQGSFYLFSYLIPLAALGNTMDLADIFFFF